MMAAVTTFVVAAGLVALVRVAPAEPDRGQPAASGRFLAQWLDGLRIVRTDRSIRVLFVVFGLMTFGGTMLGGQ